MKLRLISLLVLGSVCCFAQQQPSVADAARASRNAAVKAKKVYGEDSLRVRKTEFPDVSDSANNSQQIVSEITRYYIEHTPGQTEKVLHEWYDAQDAEIGRMAEEALRYLEQSQGNYFIPADVTDPGLIEREQRRRSAADHARYLQLRTRVLQMNQNISRVHDQLAGASRKLDFHWLAPRELPEDVEIDP